MNYKSLIEDGMKLHLKYSADKYLNIENKSEIT